MGRETMVYSRLDSRFALNYRVKQECAQPSGMINLSLGIHGASLCFVSLLVSTDAVLLAPTWKLPAHCTDRPLLINSSKSTKLESITFESQGSRFYIEL